MMKILVIDNNLHIRAYNQGAIVKMALGLDAAKAIVKKPDDLTWKSLEFSRVILTGSMAYVRQEEGWMEKEREIIQHCLDKNITILGICFGAQLLARHIFGKDAVKPMPIPITGSINMKLNQDCPIFRGLPNNLGVTTTHYDGITVPEKYNIASVEEWPCYGFQYKNAFGIQFHPELMGSLGRALIKLQRLAYDRHVYQDFSVKTDASHGRKIYGNFIRL